jgi:acyl-CoA synthetase (AMP-forming)/AMP-acid ligase II
LKLEPLSQEELDRQAKAIAVTLQASVAEGHRVVIAVPLGSHYIVSFLGCFYAGVTVIPFPPLDSANLTASLERLQALVKDAQATVVLTTQAFLSFRDAAFFPTPDPGKQRWLAVEDLSRS